MKFQKFSLEHKPYYWFFRSTSEYCYDIIGLVHNTGRVSNASIKYEYAVTQVYIVI